MPEFARGLAVGLVPLALGLVALSRRNLRRKGGETECQKQERH